MNIYQKIWRVGRSLGKVAKDKTNPFFNSKYFDINILIEKLAPLLEKEGLVIIQPLTNVDGRPAIKTIVSDGETEISDTVTLPDLQDSQKAGGAITYFRRYSIQSLFCLEAEDDDGNTASGKKKKDDKVADEDIDI